MNYFKAYRETNHIMRNFGRHSTILEMMMDKITSVRLKSVGIFQKWMVVTEKPMFSKHLFGEWYIVNPFKKYTQLD